MNYTERRGIAAIGNLIVDETLCCNEYPQETMLTIVNSIDKSCGGGCTNVLFDLSNMDKNLPLFIVGIVGNDDNGLFILNECIKNNIDNSQITVVDAISTSFTKVIIDNQNGKRTFFHHIGSNKLLDVTFFEKIDVPAKIMHVAYLLLLPALEQKDIEYGTIGARCLFLLKQKGFKVSLDLVSDPNKERYVTWVQPVLKYVDYLIINDEESYRLTGVSECKDFIKQAKLILEYGVNSFVCIHYPAGAVLVTHDAEYEVKSYYIDESEIVSSLGAGDAFCAGLLYGIHQNLGFEKSLKLACASAFFNLKHISATDGAVNIKKILDFIKTQGG